MNVLNFRIFLVHNFKIKTLMIKINFRLARKILKFNILDPIQVFGIPIQIIKNTSRSYLSILFFHNHWQFDDIQIEN